MNWRAILASPLGFLIGLSLGALGGGGSILAVPALVYGAGQTPKQATTTSLLLVGITSVIGIIPLWRAGRVRVFAGTMFGILGVGGSLLGSRWNKAVDADLLLFAFSLLMFVAAWAMWRRQKRSVESSPEVELVAAEGSATVVESVTVTRFDVATIVKVIVAGSFVGLLTGFFGVGGGFVIVPALVLALGFTMTEAAATSLLVIAINSAVALATRFNGGTLEWGVVLPFLVASLLGVVAGTRAASRYDASVLQRWFVWLLVAVAGYTAIRSGVALF